MAAEPVEQKPYVVIVELERRGGMYWTEVLAAAPTEARDVAYEAPRYARVYGPELSRRSR